VPGDDPRRAPRGPARPDPYAPDPYAPDPDAASPDPFARDPYGYDDRPDYSSGWRDPTDPAGFRAATARAPRYRESRGRRGRGGGLPPEIPTLPAILAGITAIVLAFIIGRATGGGGGDSSAVSTKPTAVVATSVTTLKPETHTVQKGETLAGIAQSFGVTVDEIAIFNNIGDLNHVFVGQILKIPAPGQVTTVTTAAVTTTTKKKGK
jgi:LysM repeat protein